MSEYPPQLLRVDLQRSLRHSGVHPEELPPFQRVLLTTDGMVTELLEAFYWEQMKVIKISQDLVEAEDPIPDLEIDEGTTIIKRQILLQGKNSGINRLYASSILVPGRLDEKMQEGLFESQRPIGLLILEDRLETFREILDCGKEPDPVAARNFGLPPETAILYRTYRVFASRKPIMLITEKFPPASPSCPP